jgi:hypothetical protein
MSSYPPTFHDEADESCICPGRNVCSCEPETKEPDRSCAQHNILPIPRPDCHALKHNGGQSWENELKLEGE